MEGLKDAQEKLKGRSHGRICPTFLPSTDKFHNHHVISKSTELRPISLVDFDIAVEATEESDGGAGIKVMSGLVNFAGSATTNDVAKVATRLKFSVPVTYPDISGDPTSAEAQRLR